MIANVPIKGTEGLHFEIHIPFAAEVFVTWPPMMLLKN